MCQRINSCFDVCRKVWNDKAKNKLEKDEPKETEKGKKTTSGIIPDDFEVTLTSKVAAEAILDPEQEQLQQETGFNGNNESKQINS